MVPIQKCNRSETILTDYIISIVSRKIAHTFFEEKVFFISSTHVLKRARPIFVTHFCEGLSFELQSSVKNSQAKVKHAWVKQKQRRIIYVAITSRCSLKLS